MDEEDEWGEFNLQPAEEPYQPPPPEYNEAAYQQSTEPDYFRRPTEEDTSIPEAAQYTAGADPWAEFNLQPAPTAAAAPTTPKDDPWSEFNLKPPEAESGWGTLARRAVNNLASTLGGLSGGAIAAGVGGTLGRVIGGVGGSALLPGAGTVGGWLAGGLAGGALGEYVYSEGKKMLGWDDSIQEAINAKAHPMWSAAGEVAPLALGLSPGRGLQTGARLLSGAVGGVIEGGSQAVHGEFSPEKLFANVGAGALLPGNRGWLTRIEGAGKEAAGRMGFTPPVETAGGKASEWTGPPADIVEAPPPAQGEFPGLKPFEEDVAGGRQMELPLEPTARPPEPTGQGKLPLGPEPVIDENGQYRFSTSGAEEGAPRYDHGTPGPEAAAGTSEAQTPPPKSEAHGPEDWGKKTAPKEGAAGVNVGRDPTLDFALNPDQPIKAQQAGPMKDLDQRLADILAGHPADAPAELRKIADDYRKMGQGPNAEKVEAVAKAVEQDHATRPPAPRAAAAERTADVLRGPEPAPLKPGSPEAQAAIDAFNAKPPPADIDARMREQGVPPRQPGEPLQTATPEEINARMREQGVPPQEPPPAAAGDLSGKPLKELYRQQVDGKRTLEERTAATQEIQRRQASPDTGTEAVAPKFKTAKEQSAFERGRADAQSGITAKNMQEGPQARAYEAGVRAEQEKLWGTKQQQQQLQREGIVRDRSGRPIETAPLPIGTEPGILERGYERATGPKEEPRAPGIQALEREGPTPPSKPRVTTHDGAVFTGDTVAQAAANARAAGYREHQIRRPKETAEAPRGGQVPPPRPEAGGAGGKPPPQEPSAGGKPPPMGDLPPVTKPVVAGPPRRFDTARAVAEKVLRRWQETFQPETISPGAMRAEPLFRGMKSARSGERDRVFHATKEGEKRWDATPEEDRYKFLSDVEKGNKIKPEQQADANNLRRLLDEASELEKVAGLKTHYRENYFPHEFKKLNPGQQPLTDFFRETLGPNWFTKHRTIDLIEQARAAGYELKNSNPYAAVRSRLMAGADMRMQKRLLDDLRTMGMAGHSEEGTNARLSRMGYQAINGPDGKQWMLSPEIQPLWKNAISGRSLWSDPNLTGDAFRGWMQFKAFWVPIKLALSGFHALHVGHINFSSNLARSFDQVVAGDMDGAFKSMGQAFSTTFHPRASLPGGRSISSKDVQAQWILGEGARTPEGKLAIQHMEEGGFVPHMAEQLRSDAEKQLHDSWKNMNPFGLAYHAPRELIRRIQAPLFETWIPRVKTAAYLNDVAALMARKPELNSDHMARKASLSAIAKSIDNRFGEMFYDGLFWNRMTKDVSIGSFLSLGWNLGFAREFGGAAIEAATRPGGKFIPGMKPSAERQIVRDATNKVQFASIYMGTAMVIGGAMTKMFTGENPSDLNDYIFPRVGGSNPDGSPRRLTTMFYTREVPMVGKHISEHGGGIGGTLAGITDMVWNKTLFQPFKELLQNKSYFGREIWDSNAPGYTKLMQAGKHIFGEQFSPMAMTGAQQSERKMGLDPKWYPTTKEGALSYIGFGPAPAYAEHSNLQNRIGSLFREHVTPASRPYQDPDVTYAQKTAHDRLALSRQPDSGINRQEAVREAKKAGLSQQSIDKIGRIGSDQSMFARLPKEDQISILKQATPEERQRYWKHTSTKTRQEWNKTHPVRTQ